MFFARSFNCFITYVEDSAQFHVWKDFFALADGVSALGWRRVFRSDPDFGFGDSESPSSTFFNVL